MGHRRLGGRIAIVCTVGIGLLSTSSVSAQAPTPATAPPGYDAAAMKAVMQPMELTETQVQGLIAAMKAFRELGDEAENLQTGEGTDPAAFVTAMQFSERARDILRKNGFKDPTEFQKVTYNTFMALGVLQRGGTEAIKQEMAAAKAEQAAALEQIRQHLPPEQAKLLEEQAGIGMAVAESAQNVPERNLSLVKQYREQIEGLQEE